MNCYGVSVNLKNIPELDPEFTPLLKFNEAFLKDATKPVSIAVERADGQMAACHTKIHEEAEMTQANHYYIDRLVKTMIWLQGGFRVYVNDKDLYDYLSSVYCKGGAVNSTGISCPISMSMNLRSCSQNRFLRPKTPPLPWEDTWKAAASALMPADPTVRFLQ